jgi:hypothetical protein
MHRTYLWLPGRGSRCSVPQSLTIFWAGRPIHYTRSTPPPYLICTVCYRRNWIDTVVREIPVIVSGHRSFGSLLPPVSPERNSHVSQEPRGSTCLFWRGITGVRRSDRDLVRFILRSHQGCRKKGEKSPDITIRSSGWLIAPAEFNRYAVKCSTIYHDVIQRK